MRSRAWLASAVLALLLVPALPAAPVPGPPLGGAPLGIRLEALPLADVAQPVEAMLPRPAGSLVHTTFLYGPHVVPQGWDLDRYALALPFETGFVTKLAFRLQDAATGEVPTNLQVHIHHALWFGAATGTLSPPFIFGTGEERTQIDLASRAAAAPHGPLYGIPFMQDQAQVLVLMLHNKQTVPRVVTILLDVEFVYGTAPQVADARRCRDPLRALPVDDIDGCVAGRDVHGVRGGLWGDIFDVPRQPQGDGVFTYPLDGIYNRYGPADYGLPVPTYYGFFTPRLLNASFLVPEDATLVFAQGHLHPNGMATIVANLGPDGSGCDADLDGDGLPGTTLFRSDKLDRNPAAWPYSEDFQMGVTKPGFRAPLRAGDRLAQFGLYANREVATYQAMTFAAIQMDPAQAPGPRGPGCARSDFAPRVVDAPGMDATATVPNRAWDGPELALCDVPGSPACNAPVPPPAPGLDSPPAVAIAQFAYAPGDANLAGALGLPPVVHAGRGLTFVNVDTAAVVRHTVTSCAWPCNGAYTANYPRPDGVFDSDRLGNLDVLDGGSIPPDPHDDPLWGTPADLPPGFYSYFCRLHPTMRGAFEVVP
ncbi:MAG: hypothetical protein LC624_09765 [Halobacteriales archaeon]|nr:hypothetical protein [Halobacteriales archaeon]